MLGTVLKPVPLDLLAMGVTSAAKQVTLWYVVTAKLESFISQGKIHWNYEGKVVLLSGAMILNYIGKQLYMECIDKWHRLNPNQLITGCLSANASPDKEQLQGMSQTFIHEVIHVDTSSNGTLSQEERVAALERELYALCCPAKVFDGVEIPCAKTYQPAPPPAMNNTATMPNAPATNDNAATEEPLTEPKRPSIS